MDVAYVSVVDSEGYPSVATRSNIKPDGISSCYFSTGTNDNMAIRIKGNNKGGVCFRKDGDNVSLVGEFEIIDDMETNRDLWVDWFIDYFPEGVEDPNYCIVRFKTKRISLWIDYEYEQFNISDIK
jgi:general stress protein 26